MHAKAKLLQRLCWTIALIAVMPTFIAWYSGPRGGLFGITAYDLFPLLGLIAYALMWSHYMVAALRIHLGLEKSIVKRFKTTTGWIVLVLVILHPSLLVYSLWRDGLGLPPESYLRNYIVAGTEWAAFLGAFSLLLFLAYELHRWFENRQWWSYVRRMSDLGMILIFIHGVTLGGELGGGWFRVVWFMYGAVFMAVLLFTYLRESRGRNMVG